jgi:DNA polymerase I
MKAVLDIETTLDWKTIHLAGVFLPETGQSIACLSVAELRTALKGVSTLIGHNIIGFDMPRLEEVWEFTWDGAVEDTLVLGRLLNPSIEGGHALKQWAIRAGKSLKEDFETADFNNGLTDQMIQYCLADCAATWDVYEYITTQLTKLTFSTASLELEHGVARLVSEQVRNGFALDFNMACELHHDHEQRMLEIEQGFQKIFPPIVEERWSEKTGKRLKDKVTVFNPGSREQVAQRLSELGAKWKRKTPTGKPVVDEHSLADNKKVPEAAFVLEYMTLQKRVGMLKSWIDAVETDGRIRGYVNTCGAVTGRMTHSKPNMAQIPSEAQYRACFTVGEGNVLVGADAAGLELRCLAHYMKDEEYIRELLEGDVHTATQTAAGLATRADAKRFTYALLYGAGNAKLGSILGGSAQHGKRARDNYLRNMPAFGRLVRTVESLASEGSVPGIDGRRVWIRSQHAALNTLLQSCGAIVMKQALVIAADALKNIPHKFVANVHDEFQVETPEYYGHLVGRTLVRSIIKAGEVLEMRCQLDGEYKIGKTWAETH